MKIEVYEIATIENEIYQELLKQYKTNLEVKELLDITIIPSKLILAGDLRIITMMKRAIEMNIVKVSLVKDVDKDIFLWAIGQDFDNGKIKYMFPLLKKQNKKLQLEIRKVLIEKGLMKEKDSGINDDD